MEKSHQVVWNSWLDYERIEWQWTLTNLEKAPDVTYQDVFEEFNMVWCVKDLLVTCKNLTVIGKIRPQMNIIS